ncbi:MAG: DUF4384 domain-containing protein [Methylomicrobium sp.]
MIKSNQQHKSFRIIWLPILIAGCGLNPQNADIGLEETLPEAKVTVYQQGISQLGLMTSIYSSAPLKIMTKDILDNTGTSVATNAEIPRDITEMVKSTLNGIGGNVLYIPYEPEFMQNTAGTGYSDYGDKILPQVVLSGGITEFDRGLVTKGDSLEMEVEIGSEYGFNFADQNKASLSSVTLDFNLIDFKTFTGIPRIQAVNGIKLHKATKEDSIGFTIKSATFGAKGEVKKVQGRHAAVRLLVQLSMMQMIGRYQKLPYWRLVPGATRDDVVIDQVLADFYAMTQPEQIAKTQELLYLHGYSVTPNGQLDGATQSALQNFAGKQKLSSTNLDQNLYLALYENVPLSPATRQLRKNLDSSNFAVAPRTTFDLPLTPKPAPAPAPAPAAPKASPSEIVVAETGKLTLTTNKSEFKIGESLKINFSVSEPMYVRVVVINSKGEVSTIFPNVYQSDNYCKPGITYSIPSAGADFSLDIGEPVGTDKLRAVASKKPIPAEALYFTPDGQFDEAKMASYSVRAAADYVIR